jgi:phosphoribosylaminoimidazole-succinocarboxamide synthase
LNQGQKKPKGASPLRNTALDIPGLKLTKQGKVRDIYDAGEDLLLVASDRVSAFDVVLPTLITGKGEVLTQLSRFWFNRFAGLIPNHLSPRPLSSLIKDPQLLAVLEPRTMRVRKARPLGVEAIVRGYLSGSGWQEYKNSGTVSGIKLPAGLRESDQLPEPLFTPSTKAEIGLHDENISFEKASEILGRAVAEQVRALSLKIYLAAAEYARSRQIIIADTKFEFGLIGDTLVLIDEVLTPDSSRFWPLEHYQPGQGQPSLDKQYVRDWLLASGWDKTPPGPELPENIVRTTAQKYREILQILTRA